MDTKAPSYSDEQMHQQQLQQQVDDMIPAVASSGSCVISVNSLGDIGSVGSNSTKTRFSFYNAQEVQKEEKEKQGPSEGMSSSSSGVKKGDEASNSNNKEPHTLNASKSSSSTTSDQRFNFYVAEGADNFNANVSGIGSSSVDQQQQQHKEVGSKEEDDRRSPHTPLVTDADEDKNDNKRTPAAVVASISSSSLNNGGTSSQNGDNSSNGKSKGKGKSNIDKVNKKGSSPNATPVSPKPATPRGNHTSAQKKKQKAVQAAAVRARNSNKIDERNAPSSESNTRDKKDEQSHLSTTTNDDDNNEMDSVEILRSLKDTEQMRYNLMKQCEPTPAPAAATIATSTANSNIATLNSKQPILSEEIESHTSQEIYEDAETFDSDGLQQLQAQQLELVGGLQEKDQTTQAIEASATSTVGTATAEQQTMYNDYRNTVQRPATSVSADGSSNSNAGNPYEDAIREALDLLRKHRPPSPQHHLEEASTTEEQSISNNQQNQHTDSSDNNNNSNLGIDMNVVQGATSGCQMRSSPRSGDGTVDRVTQSRWESPHQHDPEEVDARRKERQERLARYTSRLAEIKNNDEEGYKPTPVVAAPENDSTPDSQRESARVSPVPTDTHDDRSYGIPDTCLSGDLVSLGAASSLSGSQYGNSATNPKEVHRSVERVLLAILERAHSNGRASLPPNSSVSLAASASLVSSLAPTTAAKEKQSTDYRSDSPVTQPPLDEDPLLRAVGQLLSSSGAGSSSVLSGSASPPPRQSDDTEKSSVTAGTKRSVVEELLAEAESFGGDQAATKARQSTQSLPDSDSHDLAAEKPANNDGEDLLNCSTGVEAVRSDADAVSTVVHKGLDELVLKTLGKSSSKSKAKRRSETPTDDDEDETSDNEEDIESQSRSGSYDDDDEDAADDTYDDDEDSQGETDEDLDDALEGVLGPLNSRAGGTTGVVLESNLSPDRSHGEQSIFDTLSNAMSSIVASAISGEEKQSIASGHASKLSGRDKYSTDMDNDGKEKNILDVYDEQASFKSAVDDEASELMRSLCAHLLPFGVDQSNRFLDEVPKWDNKNPNEAGYRIIRLTSQQLQRVEYAFESMVLGLKKTSENNLIADGNHGDIDASFERDLAVAEKALDGEEEDRTTAIMKALKLVPGKTGKVTVEIESDSDDDIDVSVDDSESVLPDVSHPDFPGIHSAGKGEMGDLEYFQLPIIFKSNVTGFEPTKDMCLEAGNVVAGQYLVESELGTAAFSTAYKCVDLNSEGNDTEDGHQEVCLKVIKNTKDFFDQSLDEIKILELLRQTGKCEENNILQMKTFFYHREHLIIVTELLRQNLFEFGKFILDHDEEPYFTLPRLGYITRQCLVALRFVHKLGLVHSDIKPENILLGSYSRAQAKVIDFGSSCYLTDRQSSYIQSRSYRAPEVVLGLPYDGKIDVWSLGCVVAEMLTGEVTFQNDSMVSMLSRIEAISGPFPRHMIAQGRQSCRFFTKCGLLFEKVSSGEDDGQKTPDVSEDEDADSQNGSGAVFDIFQPKTTTFSTRLGFPEDLLDRYASGAALSPSEEKQAMFVDFVRQTLTIDPDSRPSAAEALKHPWMKYAASLSEEDIKYPSQ